MTIPLFLVFGLTAYLAGEGRTHILLIGVGDYHAQDIQDLQGPANDVRLMNQTLSRHFPDARVHFLMDEAATKDAILSQLKTFASFGKQDSFIIYFSGHGSFQEDDNRDEENGRDESWVTYGARPCACQPKTSNCGEPSGDLMDDQLFQYLSAIPSKRVVVISDSCHSGSMGRDYQSRGIPPVPTKNISTSPNPEGPLNGVRLAAASDDQKAYEKPFEGKVHGLFTFHLAQALAAASTETPWKQVFMQAQRNVSLDKDVVQSPQIEGDGLLPLGAGNQKPVMGLVMVQKQMGDLTWQLNQGSAVGLAQGARLVKNDVILEVMEVTSFQSRARSLGKTPPEAGMFLKIERHSDQKRTLALHGEETPDKRLAQIRQWLKAEYKDHFSLSGHSDPEADWHLILRKEAGDSHSLWFSKDGITPSLSQPMTLFRQQGERRQWQRLDHAMRALIRREILLNAKGAPEQDILFEPLLYVETNGSQSFQPGNKKIGGRTYKNEGVIKDGAIIPAGSIIFYRIKNQGPRRRYVYVVNLGPEGGVSLFFPREDRHDGFVFRAGSFREVGLQNAIKMGTPGTEYLLVISSRMPLDTDFFKVPPVSYQDPLGNKASQTTRDSSKNPAVLRRLQGWSSQRFRFEVKALTDH